MTDVAARPTTFLVNGREVAVTGDPIRRLSEVLRDDLGLTGTKVGCDAGDCGACTVRLDGEPVCACLVPLGQVDGRDVATVEGLARDGELAPVQAAFVRTGGAQCGICTPGMLMAADALLDARPAPSEAEVMDALGGVLCRCTGYRKIIDAVTSTDGVEVAATPATRCGGRCPGRAHRRDRPGHRRQRVRCGSCPGRRAAPSGGPLAARPRAVHGRRPGDAA